MRAAVAILAAMFCGCPDDGTTAENGNECAFDVDASYVVGDATDGVKLWDWRNPDCAREQLQVVCRGESVDIICAPCEGHCGTTTQTWTLNDDGTATFEEVDSAGEESSERVSVRRQGTPASSSSE